MEHTHRSGNTNCIFFKYPDRQLKLLVPTKNSHKAFLISIIQGSLPSCQSAMNLDTWLVKQSVICLMIKLDGSKMNAVSYVGRPL